MDFADTVIVHTKISLSWKDRIRVLFRGGLRLVVEVETEHLPGAVQSSSRVEVPRLFPSRDRGGGWHSPEDTRPIAIERDGSSNHSEQAFIDLVNASKTKAVV